MAKKGSLKTLQKGEVEERPVRLRRYKYLFLIVCEDQNTEPTYFLDFKSQIPDETIHLVSIGTGRDSKGVVEQAIVEKAKLSFYAKREVDVVWAVFDKDDADENATKIRRFEESFELAKNNFIELAYSNEVFELWLLLHLIEIGHEEPISRIQIYASLQEQIRANKNYQNFVYEHGKADILEVIKKIGSQKQALARAEILMKKQLGKQPILANPSTRVYVLVKELLQWIAYYGYKSEG